MSESVQVPSWEEYESLRGRVQGLESADTVSRLSSVEDQVRDISDDLALVQMEISQALARIAVLEAGQPDPEPDPDPEPPPTAPVKAYHQFETLPSGSVLPNDIEATEAVLRHPWEARPANGEANEFVPGDFDVAHGWSGYSSQALNQLLPRISGRPRFTDSLSYPQTFHLPVTTDELIRWAACKWGIDDDIVRAICWQESHWRQSAEGDMTTIISRCPIDKQPAPGQPQQCPESYGITQIKHRFNLGTYPLSRQSTAFNLDYALGKIRAALEGWTYAGAASRGDLWGSIGMHYSGTYGSGYASYVSSVQNHLANKPWLSL